MNHFNPFKGKIKIEFKKSSKDPKFFEFDSTPNDEIKLDQTLMCKFSDFDFSEEEKSHLSKKDRELICRFKNINCSKLKKDAESFLKLISNIKNEVSITANGYGAYICLAAIYSGKLPKSQIHFKFKSSPLALFPDKLIKKNKNSLIDIHVKYENNKWPMPFKSLCELPKYLNEFKIKNASPFQKAA